MSTNFDFLYKSNPNKITAKNIHDICFVHSNSTTKPTKLRLSPDSVQTAIFDFTEIPFSWGKLSGDVLWASPYSAEFISMPEYKIGKYYHAYSRFYNTRMYRSWDNYDDDGIPIVAFSDWDAYTQLENPSFTARRCSFFKLSPDSKILIINSFADYKNAMNEFGYDEVCIGSPVNPDTFSSKSPVLKFDNIAKTYDGIYVSANLTKSKNVSKAEQASIMKALSIWDVDSLVIWNDIVVLLANLSANTVRQKISTYYLGKNKKAFTKGIQYEVFLENPNIKILENNYTPNDYGTLLGVDTNEKVVYFKKYNQCYKTVLHEANGYETTCLGVVSVWREILRNSQNIIEWAYPAELRINTDSMVDFSKLNQPIPFPAATYWVDGDLLAVFFMDQFDVSHCVFNKNVL